MIVAVDGPAGSGKSSLCFRTCQRIGWTYINTGALYRAVAIIASRRGMNLEDEDAVLEVVADFSGHMRWEPESQQLYFGDMELSDDLYTAEAGAAASFVAKMPRVRDELLPLQRELALRSPVGALVDGRDIGTVVFPDADLKIFMTASLKERARRRLAQFRSDPKVQIPDDEEVQQVADEIARRDAQDASRGAAPLKRPEDAIDFDNSGMGIDEAVDRLVGLLQSRGLLDHQP